MNHDYEILQELGQGSYGLIYKVHKGNCVLVLKEINTRGLTQKQQQEAMQEVSIMSQLNHPNVIKYVASHLAPGKIRIFMELADRDLSMIGQQNESQIWMYIGQLIDGLEYLHRLHIIHRDIKPSNILLKDGVIKISDLGVSKQCELLMKTRVGTPLFLAPELVKNKPYDNKIDIWALGCVIYYLCQREPPFTGHNMIALGYNIVNRFPKPIDARYSKKLQSLITRMLNKCPILRPSAKECQEFIGNSSITISHRLLKAQSCHSQSELHKPQDAEQKIYYNVYQLRLQRIVSQQKELKQLINNQDRDKYQQLKIRLQKGPSYLL